MLRFYSPIFILQIFCVYHAYSNKADRNSFLLILFFPLIGSLIYLYKNIYIKDTLEDLSEGINHVFTDNYKLKKLERQLKFSDTITNKIALANEYVLNGAYEKAEKLYEDCLNGLYKDDPNVIIKLIYVYYQQKKYEPVIHYSTMIKDSPEFKKSTTKLYYAWALFHLEQLDKSEQIFKELNTPYSNYEERLAYAKFLHFIHKKEDSIQQLKELLNEFEFMGNTEKKQKKKNIKAIQGFYASLQT